MERCWFNSTVFKKELQRGYGIKKLMDNLSPFENTSESEDLNPKVRIQKRNGNSKA